MTKRLFAPIVLLLLTGCVARQYEIQQDIAEDETLSATISEYKTKKEYQEIIETQDFIKSIEQKNETILTESEYNKLQDIDINAIEQVIKDMHFEKTKNLESHLQKVCHQCHNIECETHKNGGIIYSANPCCSKLDFHKASVVKKVATLTDSFMEEYSTYCEKYNRGMHNLLTDYKNYSELRKEAVENCQQELNAYFCSHMFSSPDFNINFSNIESKMSEYWDKKWEKRTGCKKSKSTQYMGIYQVLQQTSSGTLAVVNPREASHLYFYQMPEIVFITKNKIDSKLVDGEDIPSGDLFEEIGIYKYTTTLGSTSTVKKYRRCLDKN